MNADLEGLNECDWLLKMASESSGQIKYYEHGKVAVLVGNQQVEIHNNEERLAWYANIVDLETDGHIVLLNKRVGVLTFTLTE